MVSRVTEEQATRDEGGQTGEGSIEIWISVLLTGERWQAQFPESLSAAQYRRRTTAMNPADNGL